MCIRDRPTPIPLIFSTPPNDSINGRNFELSASTSVSYTHLIYGVQGNDKNNLPFLSPQWMNMLQHTEAEGKRIGKMCIRDSRMGERTKDRNAE